MKRKSLFKNIIAISVIFGAMVLLGTGSSKAVLQSNGNDGAAYSLGYWMLNVRKMEELGGAMGLSETVGSNLTSSSDANNIDVHMEKNTEYGALAILSASSYGNPNKVNDGETTTGNATGVVMKLNYEWTAASIDNIFSGYVNRYKNIYYGNYSAKRGDAIAETFGWHGSNYSWRPWVGSSGVLRSNSSGIFSYWVDSANYNWMNYGSAYIDMGYRSRAVIVQGDGI